MSCGCTCCDEVRGDESGQRQQKLLKGKLHRAGRVAIVFWLWTHHIQEDINASPLLCHAIELGFHCLLIKRVYLRGVGHPAALVNVGISLLNSLEVTTRKKDGDPLRREPP